MAATNKKTCPAVSRKSPNNQRSGHDNSACNRIYALLIGAALGIHRFDVAMIVAALALAGWPR